MTVIEIHPVLRTWEGPSDTEWFGEGALQSGEKKRKRKKNHIGLGLRKLLLVFKPRKDFEIQEAVSHSEKEGVLSSILLAWEKLIKHRVGEAGHCGNYTFNSKGFRQLSNTGQEVEYWTRKHGLPQGLLESLGYLLQGRPDGSARSSRTNRTTDLKLCLCKSSFWKCGICLLMAKGHSSSEDTSW